MAHTCPDCDSLCYCGGDIDDMQMDDTPEQRRCNHWRECDADADPDEGPWESWGEDA